MNASPLVCVILLLATPSFANEAAPKKASSGGKTITLRPAHPVQGPTAWGGLVLNNDTWADEGAGLVGGLQWVVVPELGPGALTVGPTVGISSQSDTRRDAPCDRRFKENIVEVTGDVRWVVPVSKQVRPFVKAGPGLYWFDTEYRDDDCFEQDDSELDLGFMLGFGAEVSISSSVSLYGAVDVHESEDDWIALNLGVSIPF